MTATTRTPREVADVLIEAQLTALESSLRRWRQHHWMWVATGLDGVVWDLDDLRDRLEHAVEQIEHIEFGATEDPA